VWEQELYKPFKYNKLTSQFHYFDTEDCIAGLNFSCDNEAFKFYSVVNDRIRRREEKMEFQNQIDDPIINPIYSMNTNTSKEISKKKSRFFENIKDKVDKLINKSEEKKIYSKLEIGVPQNFQHKQHIGSDGHVNLNFTK
jgi:neural Wiskott-Aldrich syndrome protein